MICDLLHIVRSIAEDLMELNKSHITFSSVMFTAGSSYVCKALMSAACPSRLCLSPPGVDTHVSTLVVSRLLRDHRDRDGYELVDNSLPLTRLVWSDAPSILSSAGEILRGQNHLLLVIMEQLVILCSMY